MNLAMVDRIVNALLYEGYILYPYRASAVKNQLRFNFGVVYPKAYAELQTGNDAWTMQTQCLACDAGRASLQICVRFLRVVDRSVQEYDGTGPETFRPARSIQINGQIHECWQEAVECRIDLPACTLDKLHVSSVRHEFLLPATQEREILTDAESRTAGAIVRQKREIRGAVEVQSESIGAGTSRITVRIVNTNQASADERRETVLGHSLISTHTILEIADGQFVSLLEPPADLRMAATQCRNEGTWPVLVGAPGDRDTVLSSPIILYDYPAIAPESPGDLCDSTEIDEILTLRVLTLTDEEKNQARRIDERARRILERAEDLDPSQFAKLHGTFRGMGGNP